VHRENEVIFFRYYYDSSKETCAPFAYSGCKGNANNFRTREDCRKKCKSKGEEGEVDVCQLSEEGGPCR